MNAPKERVLSEADKAYIAKTEQESEERKKAFEAKPKSTRSVQMIESIGDGRFRTRPLDQIDPAIFGEVKDPEDQQKLLDAIDSYLVNPAQHDAELLERYRRTSRTS